MNDKILIKKYSDNIVKELKSVDFTENYICCAKSKFEVLKLKFFDLKPAEANILKQSCLALGCDAAVGKNVITCKCEKSDAIVCATVSQFVKLCEKLSVQPFRLKNLAKSILQLINRPCSYIIRDKSFSFEKTYLMGILNVTPDSFSDGGKNFDTDDAFASAMQMIDDGTDIIDIGGESTRPDAVSVSFEEEIRRVLPVIKKIRAVNKDIILSIDTIHPETALAALNEGVDILNNVGSPEIFKSIFPYLIQNKTPIVITHSGSIPPVPVYEDFDGDIADNLFKFFNDKIDYFKINGLIDNLFILDAGIGFGKSINDQFELIKRADEFFALNYPVLYGISRKSFISKTFGETNRDNITLLYDCCLMQKKVNILRVHDVKNHNFYRNYLSKIM